MQPSRKASVESQSTLCGELIWSRVSPGVRLNIYTDSKYAFTTIRVHGALYKERRLINLGGKVSSLGRKFSNC
jgi:hypothetical protein